MRDFRDMKSFLRKQYKAMNSNERAIKAAKLIAKEFKISFKEILKQEVPDNNISGKSWDKDGNIIVT